VCVYVCVCVCVCVCMGTFYTQVPSYYEILLYPFNEIKQASATLDNVLHMTRIQPLTPILKRVNYLLSIALVLWNIFSLIIYRNRCCSWM
jgi:Sec-independent protein secretion pathway component TatC